MNPRLCLARVYLPSGLRKRKLAALLLLTGRALDAAPPSTGGVSLRGLRRLYAGFSREAAERAARDPAGRDAAARRLFDEGRGLGGEIRRELGVATPRDVMAAARILYLGLGIDFKGGPAGDIVIRRCSFSRHYPAEICRLMSSLDAGLLAGLAGGGELEFTERLTEGSVRCRARFTFPGAP